MMHPIATVNVNIHGPVVFTMATLQLGGTVNYNQRFYWSKVPAEYQTPGREFHASSIEVTWTYEGISCAGEKATNFTGYGVFVLTKYVTPDDNQWNGLTEQARMGNAQRDVHTNWIDRVRGEEGRGMSQGQIVGISGPGKRTKKGNFTHPAGTQTLTSTNEGKWAARLRVNHSLAKHQTDARFAAHDQIVLSTEPGSCFEIEDTGNWKGDPGNQHNHFDRYGGVVGPNDPNVPYPSAYVVKVPPQ